MLAIADEVKHNTSASPHCESFRIHWKRLEEANIPEEASTLPTPFRNKETTEPKHAHSEDFICQITVARRWLSGRQSTHILEVLPLTRRPPLVFEKLQASQDAGGRTNVGPGPSKTKRSIHVTKKIRNL